MRVKCVSRCSLDALSFMSPRCKHGGDPSTSRASLNFTLAHLTGIAVSFVHAFISYQISPQFAFLYGRRGLGHVLSRHAL